VRKGRALLVKTSAGISTFRPHARWWRNQCPIC